MRINRNALVAGFAVMVALSSVAHADSYVKGGLGAGSAYVDFGDYGDDQFRTLNGGLALGHTYGNGVRVELASDIILDEYNDNVAAVTANAGYAFDIDPETTLSFTVGAGVADFDDVDPFLVLRASAGVEADIAGPLFAFGQSTVLAGQAEHDAGIDVDVVGVGVTGGLGVRF